MQYDFYVIKLRLTPPITLSHTHTHKYTHTHTHTLSLIHTHTHTLSHTHTHTLTHTHTDTLTHTHTHTHTLTAPSIFENVDVKKGLLLQMFGGTRKDFKANGRPEFRSDLNILLCGDPATSKSQLLQLVHNL